MQKYSQVIQDSAGNALSNPTITVYLSGTTTLASLYSDNAFTAKSNPFTGDSDGTFELYAGNGRYTITVAKTGFAFDSAFSSDLLLHDPHGAITASQILANQNNYEPTNGSKVKIWRLSSDALWTITGLYIPTQTVSHTLLNVGAFPIALAHENTGSTAGGRFTLPNVYTLTLLPGDSLDIVYDLTTARWRPTSQPGTTQILDRSISSLAVTNTTAETTVYTLSLPASLLATDRAIRVTLLGRIQNTSGGNVVYTAKLKYGTTVVGTPTLTIATASDLASRMEGHLLANSSTTAQIAQISFQGESTFSQKRGTATEDSTVAKSVTITMTLDTASSSATFTKEAVLVELIR